MKESNQNKTFEDIYDEIVDFLKGNLTSKEYKELVTLEYVLTWGYNKPEDEERYRELRRKKDRHE